METPAKVRFVSAEPLIDFTKIVVESSNAYINSLLGRYWTYYKSIGYTDRGCDKIDWVIVGGESGHKARPMNPQWVRDIRDACKENGVAFFFKQWGAWNPYEYTPEPPYWYNSPTNQQVEGNEINFFRKDGSYDWIEPSYKNCGFIKTSEKIVNALDGIKYLEYPKLENHVKYEEREIQ